MDFGELYMYKLLYIIVFNRKTFVLVQEAIYAKRII